MTSKWIISAQAGDSGFRSILLELTLTLFNLQGPGLSKWKLQASDSPLEHFMHPVSAKVCGEKKAFVCT